MTKPQYTVGWMVSEIYPIVKTNREKLATIERKLDDLLEKMTVSTPTPTVGINGDDLRRTVIWISEQLEETSDTPLCADCGHGLQHHLSDRSLRSCTFPKAMGAPKALCACLDYMPMRDDDDA